MLCLKNSLGYKEHVIFINQRNVYKLHIDLDILLPTCIKKKIIWLTFGSVWSHQFMCNVKAES